MHIAWLGKKSPFCGNVTYSREITRTLINNGYKVSFLHFAQNQEESYEEKAYETEIILPFLYKSQIYTIPSPESSKILIKSLQELKPDLVHASLTLSPLDFKLPEICAALKIPLVATFHPAFDSRLRNFKSSTQYLTYQLYAPFLSHYDRVIVFSKLQRDLLVKLGLPAHKLVIIPNGVNTEKYSPGNSYFKTQFNTKNLFLYQGRIATEKNIEALLKAWKYSGMGTENTLLMVGDGPLASTLKSLYNKKDNIIWLGFIADEEKRIEILRAADVFILPSLVEGLSLSLLEAMACGVACIATDAGADGEVLEKGAGIIINTKGVTSQLKTLLPLFRDHPEIIKLLGNKARNRVLERYNLSNNFHQLEQVYRDLCPSQYTNYASLRK